MLGRIAVAACIAALGASGGAGLDQSGPEAPQTGALGREEVRALMEAVRANAESVTSYYIRYENRAYAVEGEHDLGQAPAEENLEYVETFEWWRSDRLWCLRHVHRTVRTRPFRIVDKERVRDEGEDRESELLVETGTGGPPHTTISECIGYIGGELFWWSRQGGRGNRILQGDMWFTSKSDAWKFIPSGGDTPVVLLPGGSQPSGPYAAVEHALQEGTALWRRGVELLGHECVVVEGPWREVAGQVEAGIGNDQRQTDNDGASPPDVEMRGSCRVYLDVCCPGLIRGADVVLSVTDETGNSVLFESFVRTAEARKVDGRAWVAWELRTWQRLQSTDESQDAGRATVIIGRVKSCEFRELRDDEPGIELPARTRVYSYDREDAVYEQLRPIRLTTTNFASWHKRVLNRLGPPELVLGGVPPGAAYRDKTGALDVPGFVLVALLLAAPAALLLLVHWWRRRSDTAPGEN